MPKQPVASGAEAVKAFPRAGWRIDRQRGSHVGRKGQVVIPKAFRRAVSLEPGGEVTFSRDGNAIRVERVASPDALMGRLAGHRLVEIKALHPLAYGDAFAVAAATAHDAVLLTGGPELTRRSMGCRVEDLRR